MADIVLKEGWLTSLAPPSMVSGVKTTSPLTNARPITFLKTPRVSFIPDNFNKGSAKTNDGSYNEHDKQTVVQRFVTTSLTSSAPDLPDLSHDISKLTLDHSTKESMPPINQTSTHILPNTLNQQVDLPDPDTHQQQHHGPIHFHRRAHKNVHSHNFLSNPSPLTSERRTYAVPKPHSNHPQTLTINTDLGPPLRPSTPEPISPTEIRIQLQELMKDAEYLTSGPKHDHPDPFPGIDLDYGWNRAAYVGGQMYFQLWTPFNLWDKKTLDGSMEEMTYVKRSFARFSLWAQREAMEFDEEDLLGQDGWGKVFDLVFKGEGVGLCWVRTPGSWHATKPGLLTCCRSVSFQDEVLDWTDSIRERVQSWRAENQECQKVQDMSKKRKFKDLWPGNQDMERFQRSELGWKDGVDPRAKRIRLRRRKPEKVMGDKWRARRREQENKAGRWLDGTFRQNRMWAEFHWVLNEDDPRDNVWIRYLRTFCQNGVRYYYIA